MAFNPGRFVIIDGVQISKTRALREGLIDEKGRIVKTPRRVDGEPEPQGPSSTRARSSSSARRGRGGKTKETGQAPPAAAGDDESL